MGKEKSGEGETEVSTLYFGRKKRSATDARFKETKMKKNKRLIQGQSGSQVMERHV